MSASPDKSLAGEYPLKLEIYDWSNGISTSLDGTLHVAAAGRSTLGVEEYEWTWTFSITESGNHLGDESASGRSFREFLQSIEEIHVMTVPPEEVVGDIQNIPRFSPYIQRITEAYRKVDEAELHRAILDQGIWDTDRRVVLLRQLGYTASKNSLAQDAKLASSKLDREAMGTLSELGAPFDTSVWHAAIAASRLDVAGWLVSKFGVDAEIRRYEWNNVYRQDTPLTLCIKSGWLLGASFLLRRGASTENLVSYSSPSRTEFHDISAFLKQSEQIRDNVTSSGDPEK